MRDRAPLQPPSDQAVSKPERDPSTLSYRDLERIEETEPRNPTSPDTLPLDSILVAPQVFQPRVMRGNFGADIDFAPLLVDELKRNQGKPLGRILVVPIGGNFYCVDGHHRIEAYERFGWAEEVPVEVCNGNLKEAFVASWERNSKPKLNTTRSDRIEWAWRLVQLEKHSKSEQVKASGCGEGTIARMRKKLKEEGNKVRGRPWWRVTRMNSPQEDIETSDWQEAEAEKLAATIVKNTNLKLALNPEVLARAIYLINEKLPKQLIHQWGNLSDDDDEYEELDI